jgi:hypothetical protein
MHVRTDTDVRVLDERTSDALGFAVNGFAQSA